jgi:hypothetical protein
MERINSMISMFFSENELLKEEEGLESAKKLW